MEILGTILQVVVVLGVGYTTLVVHGLQRRIDDANTRITEAKEEANRSFDHLAALIRDINNHLLGKSTGTERKRV